MYSVVLDLAAIGVVGKVHKVDVVNITSTQTAAVSLSNGYIVVDIDSAADLTGANTSECELLISYTKK